MLELHQAGSAEWMPAIVPGTVHTDLMRAGLIARSLPGSNVDSVQWVESRDWYYRRDLVIERGTLACDHVDLVFKGLDTFAGIAA